MSLYSVERVLVWFKGKNRKWAGVKEEVWITWQTALLNCAKVGRTDMLAGRHSNK